MAIDFEVRIADMVVQVDFAAPAFDLLQDRSNVVANAYAALAAHGLRLVDVKVDRPGSSLATYTLECTLFDFTVAVRFKLDRIEVQAFDCLRVKLPTVLAVVADAARTVKTSSPTVSFKSSSCTLAMHGLPSNERGLDFVRQFLTGLPPLGSVVGAGATFLFGPQNEVTSSLLVVETSRAITGGLFLKLTVMLTAAGSQPESLPAIGEQRLRDMLLQLGLATRGL
jgi:hypothetical protein